MAYNPFTQGIKQRSATGYSRISARDLDDMIGAGLSYQSTAAAREAALRRQAEADALEKANYEAQLALDEKKHNELVNAQKDAAESSKWQGIANTAGQLGTTVLALGGAKPIMGTVKALPETLGSAYQYGAGVVDNAFGTTFSQAAREAALNATIDDVLATGTAPQMSQATANLIGNTSATGLESIPSLTPEIPSYMLDPGYSEFLSNAGGNVTGALDSAVANTVAEKAAEQVAQQALTESSGQLTSLGVDPLTGTIPSAAEPVVEGGLGTGAGVVAADVMAPTTIGEAYAAGGLPAAAGTGISNAASAVATPLSYAAPYYALAKAGGLAINSITANNPWMRDTPFGLLGQTLDEPLAVEDALSREWSRKGFGNEDIWEGLNNANPLEVGGWLKNTKEKALNVLSGSMEGVGQSAKGIAKEFGASDWGADLASDLASGGVTFVTRNLFGGGLTEDQIRDQKMRKYATALEEYAKANPDYVYSSKDSPINYNKYLGFYAHGPIYDTWHGWDGSKEPIATVNDLSDETINRLIHEGKFRSVVGELIRAQQQAAYNFNQNNPFYI